MTNAAVAAYLAGQQLAAEAVECIEAGLEPPDLSDGAPRPDWEELKTALGPDRFRFWLLRGVRDQLLL
jgi:hypothetical protein